MTTTSATRGSDRTPSSSVSRNATTSTSGATGCGAVPALEARDFVVAHDVSKREEGASCLDLQAKVAGEDRLVELRGAQRREDDRVVPELCELVEGQHAPGGPVFANVP